MRIMSEGRHKYFNARGFERGLLNVLYPRGLNAEVIMASIGGTLKLVANLEHVVPDYATSAIFQVDRAALLYWTRDGNPEWRTEEHGKAPQPGSFQLPDAIRLEGHVTAISRGVVEDPQPLAQPVPIRAGAEIYGTDANSENVHLAGQCYMVRFQTVPPLLVPGQPNAFANAEHPWVITPEG